MRAVNPIRSFKTKTNVVEVRQSTKRELLLDQLKDLGVTTFKTTTVQSLNSPGNGKNGRQELIHASEIELEEISRRKRIYKDSEFMPATKFVATEANFQNEVRKSIADDLAD